jgi:uncharacterized membrane protein
MEDTMQFEPKNWKWGIFYYNPNDSRLFVPKSIGIGWTPNFARHKSYLIPIAIFVSGYILGKLL